MRINLKLLLTTLGIVVLMSVSSTVIYYSLTNEILRKKEENSLRNSLNSFNYTFDNFISNLDTEFKQYSAENKKSLENFDIDFVFRLKDNSLINSDNLNIKDDINLNLTSFQIADFVNNNPSVVIRYQKQFNEKYIFYGKMLDESVLSEIARVINADIILYQNQSTLAFTKEFFQESEDTYFRKSLLNLQIETEEVSYNELEGIDAFTIKSVPSAVRNYNENLAFIILRASRELSEIRSTMENILLIILVTGILLSIIFTLIFTDKIRQQINLLSSAAENVSKGNFDKRAEIITKDEIGNFGIIFNNMLDELAQNERREKNYSEFIALINENPGLKDLAYSTLRNIINSTFFDFGLLHTIRKSNETKLTSVYGIGEEFINSVNNIDLYNRCIDEQKVLELNFDESNAPKLNTGSVSLNVNYLTLIPIIFNRRVIGILELGAVKKPDNVTFDYLETIEEQLAIGLTNALTLEELEDLVHELKQLNLEYQKQNEKITVQNEELRDLHSQLSEKAKELEKQKEKAEELTKLKSEFLANMSHELRTPLSSILGLTELVAKDFTTDSKNKNKLSVVLRNGKKLLTLINNILEFSKVELGKNEINKEMFSLRNFIKDLVSFAEPLIIDKKLDFKVDITEFEDMTLNTDKTKLEQILTNIIGNAIKFTEKGSVNVYFSRDKENTLVVKVSDTGIGISEEDVNIIFDEFRQADGSASRMFDGTGLGLAISKKYTELLGGELRVESRIGKGTSFTLSLPSIINEFKSNDGKGFGYSSGKEFFEKTVIVANKDKFNQKFISEYLSSHHVNVILTDTPKEAVFQYKTTASDALIIDPTLEDGTGWNSVLDLIKDKTTEKLPLILIKITEEKQTAYVIDIFDFISDEIDEKDFNRIVANIEAGFDKRVNKVFLVSDKFENYQKLKNERDNLTVKYSNNVKTAEIVLGEEIPDLILTDLFLDECNAIEFINKLKNINSIKNLPIVVIVPNQISDYQLSELNQEFERLFLNSKMHPLDVLGVIKKRLNLKDSIDIKNRLIKETLPDEELELEKTEHNIDGINENGAKHILIVDDDEDTLYTVGEVVKDLGYRTIFAHNGIECILALNDFTPDLILLDIMMPKMDGFETIKLIRKDPRYIDLQICALTAHAMLENKDVIEKNGFNDIVTKPINTDILLQKIKSLVQE